jgi:hypothetical protein
LQQHIEFALMRNEVVGGEDIGHHRTRPRKRQPGCPVALSFDLRKPAVVSRQVVEIQACRS